MGYKYISSATLQYAASSTALASGNYLKAYEAGTNTPLSMGTDTVPTSTLAKVRLNSLGLPISNESDESSWFNPTVNENYRLVWYANATDADNDALTSAVWDVDNLSLLFDASEVPYTDNATVAQFLDNLFVDDYVALRALTSSQLVDGQIVDVTDSGIAGAGTIVKTTAHGLTDNGGTVIVIDANTYWQRNYSGAANVRWFGAELYPVDSGVEQNLCADHCRATGDAFYAPEGLEFLTTVTVDLRSIRKVRYDAYLRNVTNVITMELGGDSNVTQQYYDQSVYRVQKGGASTPSIRIVGSNKNKIHIYESSYIQVWCDGDSSKAGADRYCAYNDITIYSCTDLELSSNFTPDSTYQWVNQNVFHLNFIINFLCTGISQHNGNVFHGGSFEGGSSIIHFDIGRGNYFLGVRGENSLTVQFDAGSENNHVITNWVSSANAMDAAATVINNGIGNGVRNINTIFDHQVPLCVVNYASFGVNAANTEGNIKGLAKLVADVPNRTLTSSGYVSIYTTPQFKIENVGDLYFSFRVINKTSGGVVINVAGYDSSGVAISSTGADVNYTTGGIGDKGFGVDNTALTNSLGQTLFYVKNQNAAYLEITIKASSAGVVFERLECYAVSGRQLGFSEIGCIGMIPNI